MTETKITITVVPALPGFDTANLCIGDKEHPSEFVYEPILAWAIRVEIDDDEVDSTSAYPVTADQIVNYDSIVVRQPNGTIIFPGDTTFRKGQEAEALAYAEEQYENKRRYQAELGAAKKAARQSR